MNVFLAEFIGVTILIFLGCGILAGNSLKKSGTFKIGSVAINLAWGFAVAMAVYAVGDISGAHLNPAITIPIIPLKRLTDKNEIQEKLEPILKELNYL